MVPPSWMDGTRSFEDGSKTTGPLAFSLRATIPFMVGLKLSRVKQVIQLIFHWAALGSLFPVVGWAE